ncbi:hypothetical protein NE237_015036 [Protea cynaroides]|uniref:Uncharacterized protein n=1 Tax=Protea cynaroides TaxID=273540 RepID=A0A9Q0QQJ2_9MAGN|nr:hypothetical protein NE237_015036 [Protea cynaroides]
MIEDDLGILYHQSVKYDWRPPHCMSCGVFGHSHDSCKKTPSDADTPETISQNLQGCSEPPPPAVPAACPKVIVSLGVDISEDIQGDGGEEKSGFQKDREWVPVRVKKKRSGLRECLNPDRPLTRLPPPGRQSASFAPLGIVSSSHSPRHVQSSLLIHWSHSPYKKKKHLSNHMSKPETMAAPAPPASYSSPDPLSSSIGHTPHPKKHLSNRRVSTLSSEDPAAANQPLKNPALSLPLNHGSPYSLPGHEPSLRPRSPSPPPRGSTLIPAPLPLLSANSAPGVPPLSSIVDFLCSHGKPTTPLILTRNLNRKNCHCNLDSSQSDEEDAAQLMTQSERNLKSIWDEKMGDDLDLPHNLPY